MPKKFKPRFWDKPQMDSPEFKEPRSLEAVNMEYTQVCAQLGQCRYRISILELEAAKLEVQIAQLEREGRSAKPAPKPEEPQQKEEAAK